MSKGEVKKVQPFMAIFGEDYDPEVENKETPNQDLVKIEQLVPFKNHPFKLYEGERLNEMVESIRQFGVIVPIVVRKKRLTESIYYMTAIRCGIQVEPEFKVISYFLISITQILFSI